MTGNILSHDGKIPDIAPDAFIAHDAVLIGDVVIGGGSSIWYGCVLRGDLNELRVGRDTNIQDGTVVHVDSKTYGTYIGDRVTIGHMALIHACTLEDECMVGMRATVMDGAMVEKGAIVAAGALVAPGKRIGAGGLWAGVPARRLRDTADSDRAMIDYIWPNYRKLGASYAEAGYDLRSMRGDDE